MNNGLVEGIAESSFYTTYQDKNTVENCDLLSAYTIINNALKNKRKRIPRTRIGILISRSWGLDLIVLSMTQFSYGHSLVTSLLMTQFSRKKNL